METTTAKAAVAEFVATFMLVFVGAGAVVLHSAGSLDLTGVALAEGLALAVAVSIGLPLSGGLVNPAVAISLWVTGRLPSERAAIAIAAELLGAVAGALLLRALIPGELFDVGVGGVPVLGDGIAAGRGILIEATLTFFLVFVYVGAVVDDRGPFSSTAGLAVGLTLAFGVLACFPYTGAAMNPARWFGPALAAGAWSDAAVWIVGPVAGGIIAAVVYWMTFLRDREPATTT